ncbi:Thioredoxin domain-containing protein 5 [Podochytrium sp. JEL0797]|nr:Thioredoxin domain-containing protein 5 [Podochytrium sp. JEL0797]
MRWPPFLLLLVATLIVSCDAKVKKCKPRVKQSPGGQASAADAQAEDCADDTLLDAETFPVYIAEGTGAWLVFFGTSWCPYCQKLMPEWMKVSETVADKGPYGIGIARFDCTEPAQKQFCHNNGVKKYPNIRLYSNGSFIEKYMGDRSTGAILDFVRQKSVDLNLESDSIPPPTMQRALPPMPNMVASDDSPPSDQANEPPIEGKQQEPPIVQNNEPPPFNEPPATTQEEPRTNSVASESPSSPQQQQQGDSSAAVKPAPPTQQECTLSWASPLSCQFSKILSLIVVLFGAFKLYQPFFAVRKPSVPLLAPFLLDATASSLVFVYCLRMGFPISAYAELALFALTGVYVALAGWEFSSNHDHSQLRIMSIVFTMALMTPIYILPELLTSLSPYVAAVMIYANRFVVQRRKPNTLPGVQKAGTKGMMNLDFAGLVIVSRIVTTFVELKGDLGVLCYYLVLGCIHIFGDVLFASGGRSGKVTD